MPRTSYGPSFRRVDNSPSDMSEPGEKKRSRCQRMLSREAFAKNRASRDGYRAYCRECPAEYHQRRRLARGKKVLPKDSTSQGHKHCRGCGTIKPHGRWDRNRTVSDGLSTRSPSTRTCRKAGGRTGRLKRRYRLPLAERDKIADQMGIHSIGLSAPAAHVDHCHETGRVRGVLCFNCNSAIGKLGDDPDIVRRAAAYLEGNAWKPTLVAAGVYQLPS